jgi:hypothetical protein
MFVNNDEDDFRYIVKHLTMVRGYVVQTFLNVALISANCTWVDFRLFNDVQNRISFQRKNKAIFWETEHIGLWTLILKQSGPFAKNILKKIERIVCGRAYKFSAMFPQARPTLTLVQKLIVCAKFTERRMQTAFTA